MKSVQLRKGAPERVLAAEVVEVKVPTLGSGDLLVQLGACGLCGTDVEKIRGEYIASAPVLGHEAVGTVAKVGEYVKGFKIGDRIFPHHHVPCGECWYCLRGNETMCADYRKSNLDPGGFSEFFRVPAWNVERGGVLTLPPQIGFEEGTMIEPLACCIRAVDKCAVAPGQSALVVGAGPVGLANAMLLRAGKLEVMVSDVNDERLRFAERAGFERVLDARNDDVSKEVKRHTRGRGADLVIVAAGSPRATSQALKAVRRGGKVCLFGVPPEGSMLEESLSMVYNAEVSLIPSYGASEKETSRAARMIAIGEVDVKPLITHRFPLGRFAEALAVASDGQGMKVVIVP